jgi:hypothetical protein
VTLELRPDLVASLSALAESQGISVEDYLQRLIERELPATDPRPSEGSGMVWEGGLLVYRTGRPLPTFVVDDAIRRGREERSHRILGDRT